MLDQNALELHEGITQEADPLYLGLEDQEFVDTIDQFISDSVAYYENKKLPQRQEKILGYYLGNQLPQGKRKLADWQTPYIENVIYEAVRRIKPIATSRLPDLTVQGKDKKVSGLITDVLNTDIQKRKNRRVLGMAHVHEQLFLVAPIKARWNPELGTDGDYEFINIYPKNIVWDHTCKTNNADDMRVIAENAEISVKELIMMFPDKEDELLEYLGYKDGKKPTEKGLATKIKVWEVWFHWYKQTADPDTGIKKWEKIHGVVWKYETLVLGKMKNPYFDYEGKIQLFDPKMKEKGMLSDEELLKSIMQDASTIEENTIYYNYFKTPRKPYFFMVYESLGQDPIDATNRIEQILYFQDHINDEGRQIIDMNERSAGKVVINADAIDKKTAQRIDWRNTKQAVSVSADDVRQAIYHAPMPAAPAQLYKSKEENRSIAFEMMGVNATTRGVREGDQTLGEAQMFREQDFGFIDDLVEDTINEAAEWMAQWSMQFIRVFYTVKHFKQIVGKDGATLEAAIDQDFIDDGMIVTVGASAVDKMMRKRLAVENMKIGASDLLSYYEDVGADNPKERARRAFLMKAAPQLYFQTYLAEEGQTLPNQMMPQGAQGAAQPVQQPPQQGMPQGQQVPPQ